jgi:hypothetical protein
MHLGASQVFQWLNYAVDFALDQLIVDKRVFNLIPVFFDRLDPDLSSLSVSVELILLLCIGLVSSR